MIRRATEADLPEMRRVFDAARAYMAAQGNPDCMCWRMIRGFMARSRS